MAGGAPHLASSQESSGEGPHACRGRLYPRQRLAGTGAHGYADGFLLVVFPWWAGRTEPAHEPVEAEVRAAI